MYFKIASLEKFRRMVFGADSIIEHLGVNWLCNGVNVEEVKSAVDDEPNYYLLSNGKRISDSMFLSEGEVLMSGEILDGTVKEPVAPEPRIHDVRYDVSEDCIIVSGSVDDTHCRILSLHKTSKGEWHILESLANQCAEPDLMKELCNIIGIACALPYGGL